MIGTKKVPIRFSYANVWVARAMNDGDDPKYGISLLIDKDDDPMVKKIKAAIKAAVAEGKSSKWGGKIPRNYKYPLRDGDEERPDDENYANMYFINASSKTKPGIVDEEREDIIDADAFYSGCFGRATVNFYPFKVSGSSGIAAGLENLQKLKDGEPLGGARVSAFDDFADDDEDYSDNEVEEEDEDLEDML